MGDSHLTAQRRAASFGITGKAESPMAPDPAGQDRRRIGGHRSHVPLPGSSRSPRRVMMRVRNDVRGLVASSRFSFSGDRHRGPAGHAQQLAKLPPHMVAFLWPRCGHAL